VSHDWLITCSPCEESVAPSDEPLLFWLTLSSPFLPPQQLN